MDEIKPNKELKSDGTVSNDKEIITKNGPQANGKFYMHNLDDVVDFPFKIIPGSYDKNEGVNDELKNPMVICGTPWPRPLNVMSHFSSSSTDADPFRLRDGSIIADIEGNPFKKTIRSSKVADNLFLDSLIPLQINKKNKDQEVQMDSLK